MSEETPRNGVLAQCIEAFQKWTAKDASGLQKFLVAAVTLFPLLLVLVIVGGLVWGGFDVSLVDKLPWVGGATLLCSLGVLVRSRIKRTRAVLPAGAEPGQEAIGQRHEARRIGEINDGHADVIGSPGRFRNATDWAGTISCDIDTLPRRSDKTPARKKERPHR